MKTLKVRQKFEPQLHCLVSFNTDTHGFEEWPTGGSTILH